MPIEISTATLEAILASAAESEVGIVVTADDIHAIRNKLYHLDAAKEFSLHTMNNPLELWIVRKGTDLVEETIKRRT